MHIRKAITLLEEGMSSMNACTSVSRLAVALRAFVALLAVAVLAGSCFAASAFAGEGFGVTSTFGTEGVGAGEFKEPQGVAVDQASEDVYVVDEGNNRVEVFGSGGAFEHQFNGTEIDGAPAGAGKEAPAKLSQPRSIAIDDSCFYHGLSAGACASAYPSNGDLYVSDLAHSVIDKLSPTGEYISQMGPFTNVVMGIAVDGAGNVWVYESGGGLSEYSDTGELARQFETGRGTSSALAVDSADDLFVAFGNETLGKFSVAGAPLNQAETAAVTPVSALTVDLETNDLYVGLGSAIAQYGPFGEPFSEPLHRSGHGVVTGGGIAVNWKHGQVYDADPTSNDVAVFTLGPTPQTVSKAPSGVSASAATLHGTLTLESSAALEYYFEYNAGSLCTGGTKTAPHTAAAGTGTLAVEAAVSGLLPDQSYSVCLVASNRFGPSTNPAMTFTTTVLPPGVSGETVSGVTPFGARVEALVNPNNQTTSCEVQYGKTTAYGGRLACEPASLAGFSEPGQSVGLTVTGGLEPETTYHYRFVAVNASHEQTLGADEQFTTSSLKKPVVQSESVEAQGPFEAGLQAQVDPEYQETTCVFEYGTEPLLKTGVRRVACPTSLGKGGAGVGPSVGVHGELLGPSIHLSGLAANTTYYYRVIATNATGTEDGAIEPYTTPALEAPSVLLQFPESTTGSTATLATGIILKYQETTCYVEYGTEPLLSNGVSRAPCDPEHLGEGSGFTFPLAVLSGLEPRTVYYYRFVAENATGRDQAPEIGEFTTLGALTGEAQEVTRTSATLGGSVYPGGVEAGYHFVYIEAARYQQALADGVENPYQAGQSTPETSLGASDYTAHAVTPVQLTGLHAGVTYDYALVATNTAGGTSAGPSETFTTSTPTPPSIAGVSAAVSAPSTASITFTLSAQGLSTRWELRLGASPSEMVYRASGNTSSSEPQTLTVSLEKLSPASTYYYKLIAVNSDDQAQPAETSEATFITLPAPIPPGLQPLIPIALLQVPAVASVKEEASIQPPSKKATGKCAAGKQHTLKGTGKHGKCVKPKTQVKHEKPKHKQTKQIKRGRR
jgi:phosphodiesterase/alkaline phosphatase D-like protein